VNPYLGSKRLVRSRHHTEAGMDTPHNPAREPRCISLPHLDHTAGDVTAARLVRPAGLYASAGWPAPVSFANSPGAPEVSEQA
jgi:hypothetical protein